MKAIILDTDLRYVREVSGVYGAGIFKWSDGNILSHEDKVTTAIFAGRIVLKGNLNVMLLRYDGKDYKQLMIKELVGEEKFDFSTMKYNEFSTFIKRLSQLKKLTLAGASDADKALAYSDFIRDQKIGRLTKENALTRPVDRFKSILDFLHFALIIVAVISIWYMTSSNTATNAPLLKQNNQSLTLCQQNTRVMINVSSACIRALGNIKVTNTLITAP